MTASKAIELNKESEQSLRQNKFPDHSNAVALGTKAIHLYLRLKSTGALPKDFRLAGETEE